MSLSIGIVLYLVALLLSALIMLTVVIDARAQRRVRELRKISDEHQCAVDRYVAAYQRWHDGEPPRPRIDHVPEMDEPIRKRT